MRTRSRGCAVPVVALALEQGAFERIELEHVDPLVEHELAHFGVLLEQVIDRVARRFDDHGETERRVLPPLTVVERLQRRALRFSA